MRTRIVAILIVVVGAHASLPVAHASGGKDARPAKRKSRSVRKPVPPPFEPVVLFSGRELPPVENKEEWYFGSRLAIHGMRFPGKDPISYREVEERLEEIRRTDPARVRKAEVAAEWLKKTIFATEIEHPDREPLSMRIYAPWFRTANSRFDAAGNAYQDPRDWKYGFGRMVLDFSGTMIQLAREPWTIDFQRPDVPGLTRMKEEMMDLFYNYLQPKLEKEGMTPEALATDRKIDETLDLWRSVLVSFERREPGLRQAWGHPKDTLEDAFPSRKTRFMMRYFDASARMEWLQHSESTTFIPPWVKAERVRGPIEQATGIDFPEELSTQIGRQGKDKVVREDEQALELFAKVMNQTHPAEIHYPPRGEWKMPRAVGINPKLIVTVSANPVMARALRIRWPDFVPRKEQPPKESGLVLLQMRGDQFWDAVGQKVPYTTHRPSQKIVQP